MKNDISPRVLEILEWPILVEELQKRCRTLPGKKEAAILSPPGIDGVRARLRKITDLKGMLRQDTPLDFSGITDIEPLVEIAGKEGILKIEELASIRLFSRTSHSIKRTLKETIEEFPGLKDEYNRLDTLTEIRNLLEKSITESNEINQNEYPVLRTIRTDLFAAKEELERSITRIIHSPASEHVLQEKIFTTRNDRWVILVKSGMKDRIKGTVHDISASGATYYIEPQEITPLNNRVRMLEKELQAETIKILRRLSGEVARNQDVLIANLRVISTLDFLTAAAFFSIDTKGSEPHIVDEPVIDILQARHPILHLMAPDSTVANDIAVGGEHRCLIISGANTGGKTVILKTIGLCVLFTMLGLHIPAGPDSRIGVFTSILADIGDDQNLSRSLSTFSGQIVFINEMLAGADEKTLVIIDEIIVGTDPHQGAALAQSILEFLVETGSTIVATTHYSRLKELATADSRFLNASVSFDIETLRPTYRLISGLPGVSYALEIAENYGLPPLVISRSRSLLDSREISVDSLIEKVQHYEQEMNAEKSRLEEIATRLAGEKDEIDRLVKTLEKRAEEIRLKEGIEFLNELKEYRKLVAGRITDLQKMSRNEAANAHTQLREIERSVLSTLEENRDKLYHHKYAPADPGSINPGDRLFIMSLEKEGRVEHVDFSKKEAILLLGSSIRTTHKFDDLYRAIGMGTGNTGRVEKNVKKKPGPSVPRKEGIPQVLQTSFNTVDIRGKRVDEGIETMERDFDRMIRAGIDTAVVIHGHGTGAMKSAVRQHLRQCPYADDFRPGESGEGGDGVTIIRLGI